MRTRLSLAVLVLLLLGAIGPSLAHASGKDVLRDCADDEVLAKTYTQAEYRSALNALATDSSEYSNCEDIIRRAQLTAAAGPKRSGGNAGGGGSTGGGGTGGGTTGTPSGGTGGGGATSPPTVAKGSDPLAGLNFDERQALDQTRAGDSGDRVSLGKGPIVAPPAVTRAPNVAGDAGLPGSVAALLVLLAAAAVLVAGARMRSRVIHRRAA